MIQRSASSSPSSPSGRNLPDRRARSVRITPDWLSVRPPCTKKVAADPAKVGHDGEIEVIRESIDFGQVTQGMLCVLLNANDLDEYLEQPDTDDYPAMRVERLRRLYVTVHVPPDEVEFLNGLDETLEDVPQPPK